MKNVTIVVPVYKDWLTLNKCILSIKKYVKPNHKVILVNDRSSEWQMMEENIQKSIEGFGAFEYYLNPENLGFVKTCNRAVTELDQTENDILLLNSDTEVTEGFLEELSEILHLCEKHGVVCPRSNNATILTMPVRNNKGVLLDADVSYSVFLQLQSKLPRYSIVPTGVGFAFLIKRELIEKFGLFDEVYSPGYNEENDFCMRINQYGYNVIMANHAYVYHFESKSFGSRKNELEIRNRNILLKKYPSFDGAVAQYFKHSMGPIEFYADLLVEGIYEKKRVLFSLYETPSAYNGTAQYGLNVFKNFYALFHEKYEIHVLINVDADELFGLSKTYPNVWHPDSINGTFHLAFIPSQIFHIEHFLILNRVSLRYVFCMQDIISIRSNYLLLDDYERYDLFRKSIRYCAGMISISEFSLRDTECYYVDTFAQRTIKTKVIYHGIDQKDIRVANEMLPFEKYFIVFGNFYKHKFLKETFHYMRDTKFNFIVLGSEMTGRISDNIYGYKNGRLTDEFMNLLVSRATAILFPSVYEGFGLPILDGIKFDKKVVVADNELNRELKEAFDNFAGNIYLFRDMEQLGSILENVAKNANVLYKGGKKLVRTWGDVAVELESFLADILADEVDVENIVQRWEDMKYVESIHYRYVSKDVKNNKVKNDGIAYARFKDFLYQRYPKLYWFLRKAKGWTLGKEN